MPKTLRLSVYALALCLLLAATAGLWLATTPTGRQLHTELLSRSPNEVIRYLKRRLQGHNKLEAVLLPPLHAAQRHIERPPPAGPLPTLGKGQQRQALPNPVEGITRTWPVASPQDIRQALLKAQPGTHIVIAPGLYPFSLKLRLGQAGRPGAPIVLSARQPGTVWLQFSQVEGILVDQPHWVFENLDISGHCKRHDDCEHAFHVVGRAAHTTLRNNRLTNFNAHIKVNGAGGHWPDHGLLAFNTLSNTAPRETLRSVVPFDLVAANHWRVQDNHVSHFSKRHGNQVAFGLFMKGASEGGRIERNLVVCSPTDISAPGVRVGISFGGGGTGATFCRDGSCQAFEHRHGLAANNIVAHCNDTALDVNHATHITLAHNTLINTSGVGVRQAPAQARLHGNLYEGVARARDGTTLEPHHNEPLRPQGHFLDADALQLQWQNPPEKAPTANGVVDDFYGQQRAPFSRPGALQ